VLWAHVFTSLAANLVSLVIVMGVALLMGFRTETGVRAWLAVAGILLLLTLALTWIAVIPGLSATSVAGVGAFAYPLIFLPFLSSAFVPTQTRPGPVRWFAEHPAGDIDRQHDPGPVRATAGRRRHLDRPRLVERVPADRLPTESPPP
jgi:ABC-type multidrug transport system permease subunit